MRRRSEPVPRGGEAVSRQSHSLEIAGSNPAPATVPALPAPKFSKMTMADVSTSYIEQKDWELLCEKRNEKELPCLIMRHCGGTGFLLYVFTALGAGGLEESLREIEDELSQKGFSERMIYIMQEARRQRIDYVRFDTDGGEIENLTHIESNENQPK